MADFSTETVKTERIDLEWYIGTENMLANCGGIVKNTIPIQYGQVRLYRKGDILISNIRPYLRKIWLATRDGGCSTDVNVIHSKGSEFSSELLYYALSQDAFFDYIMSNAIGTKMPRGDKDVIRNFEFDLPTKKDEQQKIVSGFSEISNYIDVVQKLVSKYEVIKKATVNLLLKPKGNWPVVALGTICEVCSTRRVHESDWTSTGVPFYRARELVALNEGRAISPLHISEKLYAECVASSGAIQAGDLLVTGVGSIGVPYLVKRGDRFYFKDGNVIWFKNRGKLHPKYFLHVFKSVYIQNQIEEMSCVGTVGSYTITNGKQTLIPLPPVCEQEQIVTILDSIDDTLKSLKAQLEKLQAIKQGMMTYFFG